MLEKFRNPTLLERAIFARLTSYEFEGREELIFQLAHCKVHVADENGSLDIKVEKYQYPDKLKKTIPTEGISSDIDGANINYLIHTREPGIVRMLEIYRDDGETIKQLPEPSTIKVPPWP